MNNMENRWQAPGNGKGFDSSFENWHGNKMSERSIGALQYIMSHTNVTQGQFEENIWDYLHEKGIRINSNLANKKIGMSYNVTFEGREFATIETASSNGKGIITNAYCYNVTTKPENLDLAFLTTFAIARTDQIFYN